MKRSRMQRKIDVLKIVADEEPIVPHRLAGISNINSVDLMVMLSELETQKLVTIDVIGKHQRPYKRLVNITEKGSKAIQKYQSLLGTLGGG